MSSEERRREGEEEEWSGGFCVGSAGKVILFGEHSVVYSFPAIAVATDRRTSLSLSLIHKPFVEIEFPDLKLTAKWSLSSLDDLFSSSSSSSPSPSSSSSSSSSSLLSSPLIEEERNKKITEECEKYLKEKQKIENETERRALLILLHMFVSLLREQMKERKERPGIKIRVTTTIPISAGLGSSAAFSVCIAGAMLILKEILQNCQSPSNISPLMEEILQQKDEHQSPLFGLRDSSGQIRLTQKWLESINQWAFLSEGIIHGRASGIDNTISTFGGALVFTGGKIQIIENLPHLRLMLINTRVPRDTKKLVGGVRERREKNQEEMDPVLNQMGKISEKCIDIFEESKKEGFTALIQNQIEQLIDENQQCLEFIGVGHEAIDSVIAIGKKYNLHSKLTGAGGGGCVLILLPFFDQEDKQQKQKFDEIEEGVKEDVESAGMEVCFTSELGAPGFLVEILES